MLSVAVLCSAVVFAVVVAVVSLSILLSILLSISCYQFASCPVAFPSKICTRAPLTAKCSAKLALREQQQQRRPQTTRARAGVRARAATRVRARAKATAIANDNTITGTAILNCSGGRQRQRGRLSQLSGNTGLSLQHKCHVSIGFTGTANKTQIWYTPSNRPCYCTSRTSLSEE